MKKSNNQQDKTLHQNSFELKTDGNIITGANKDKTADRKTELELDNLKEHNSSSFNSVPNQEAILKDIFDKAINDGKEILRSELITLMWNPNKIATPEEIDNYIRKQYNEGFLAGKEAERKSKEEDFELGKKEGMRFANIKCKQQLKDQKEKISEEMDDLDTELVCIDFKRVLTKRDYQIINSFFNKINETRVRLGLKEIIHTN